MVYFIVHKTFKWTLLIMDFKYSRWHISHLPTRAPTISTISCGVSYITSVPNYRIPIT